MGDHPVGMRAKPAGCGVGGKTRMYNSNRRLIIGALQILIKFAKLRDKEHSFVHDCPGRKRRNISVLRALLELSSGHIQPTVKGNPLRNIFRTFDKALIDFRHTGYRNFSQDFRMNRHLSPAKEIQIVFLGNHLEHAHGKNTFSLLLRKEKHTDAVIPGFPKGNSAVFCSFFKEAVGNLQENSDTVSHLSRRVFSGAVLQLLHNVKSVIQDTVLHMSVNINYGADSAGIVVKLPVFCRIITHLRFSSDHSGMKECFI